MKPADGIYEPLVGYLVLEQSQAAVDMLGHRLIHAKHLDLKVVANSLVHIPAARDETAWLQPT
jgi:hypothetical protein